MVSTKQEIQKQGISMDLILVEKNLCQIGNNFFKCAIGKGGLSSNKVERDGATPIGSFPLRQVFYRPDRLSLPETALPIVALTSKMGWCDDPVDPLYNQLVTLPYPGRHEELWREDHVYDLILVVGYNDCPIIAGKGSAIFIHLKHENYLPTEGCLAFAQEDLQEILSCLTLQSKVIIKG